MVILTLIGYIMIALLLMSMLAKARPKIKEPAPGKALKTIPMGLPSRFQLHRSSLLALLTGIVFGVITGWLPIEYRRNYWRNCDHHHPFANALYIHNQRCGRWTRECFIRGVIFLDLLPKDRVLNLTIPLYLDDSHCSSNPPK